MTVSREADAVTLEATRCPFCRAKLAPALTRLKSAYLRCDTCGQIWHPERLQSTQFVNRNRR